jgi:heat shock protein HslJ
MYIRLHSTFAAIALAALVTACQSTPPQAPPPAPAPPPADPSAQLRAQDWDIAAAYDAQGQATSNWRLDKRPAMRLHFESQRVSMQNLCNAINASYTLEDGRIQISRPVSTKRACMSLKLMALEQRMTAQLPTVQRFDLRDGPAPQLVLHFANGSRWELTSSSAPASTLALASTPTPQAQPSDAGEIIFLEVAPQRAACSRGKPKGAQCLRVREVRHAGNGVKQHAGQWQILQGEIEGYTHKPGVRNVLRVRRLQRQDAPAYVLDTVVESGRVGKK